MECFNLIFPHKSTWYVTVKNDIITKDYFFMECYCANPKCDCKNGIFQLFEVEDNSSIEPLAIIEYNWGTAISAQNPKLLTERNAISNFALSEFIFIIQQEKQALIDIKEHYKMLKIFFKNLKDNDFCPCGSGRKYRKCCKKTGFVKPISIDTQN